MNCTGSNILVKHEDKLPQHFFKGSSWRPLTKIASFIAITCLAPDQTFWLTIILPDLKGKVFSAFGPSKDPLTTCIPIHLRCWPNHSQTQLACQIHSKRYVSTRRRPRHVYPRGPIKLLKE